MYWSVNSYQSSLVAYPAITHWGIFHSAKKQWRVFSKIFVHTSMPIDPSIHACVVGLHRSMSSFIQKAIGYEFACCETSFRVQRFSNLTNLFGLKKMILRIFIKSNFHIIGSFGIYRILCPEMKNSSMRSRMVKLGEVKFCKLCWFKKSYWKKV